MTAAAQVGVDVPPLELTGDALRVDTVEEVARGGRRVTLAPVAAQRVRRARDVVETVLASGAPCPSRSSGR